MLLLWLSASVAMGVSFVCSLFEAILLSYTSAQVSVLATKRPRLGAIWSRFKDNIEKPIAVILIMNTAAHTMGATIAGAQVEAIYGETWLVAFSVALTYGMLQFTEVLPKTLGVRYNYVLAPVIAVPLHVIASALNRRIWFIQLLTRTNPRLANIVKASAQAETVTVRQIMTPRTDVAFLFVDQPTATVLEELIQSQHTRYPLCSGDTDHVVGMIHVKDLLPLIGAQSGGTMTNVSPENTQTDAKSVDVDLMKIKREVLFFPKHLPVLHALTGFQEKGLHLAVIVDEHGSTLGIVTLEDVVEELLGDIRDEFDVTEPDPIRVDGSGYHLDAKLALRELSNRIPELVEVVTERTPDVDTVGGLVVHELGQMPKVGDSFMLGKFRWTVTASDSRRVKAVLIEPASEINPE